MFKQYRNLWLVLGALIILSPLGLLATGTAFGEWGIDQLKNEAGFVPAGLLKFADLWKHGPLPDYAIPGMNSSFIQSALGYVISAMVGTALVVGLMSMFTKLLKDE